MFAKITIWTIIPILLFSAQIASAQSKDSKAGELENLGNGIFLEVIAAKYVTVIADTPEGVESSSEEWVVIPATFETITKTIVIQDPYFELQVTPVTLAEDGAVLQSAQASLIEIPAVTKTISRRVVKTPSRVVKRTIPSTYNPGTRRKKVSEAAYVFRDEKGTEIKRYEDPLFAMRFIEQLPN